MQYNNRKPIIRKELVPVIPANFILQPNKIRLFRRAALMVTVFYSVCNFYYGNTIDLKKFYQVNETLPTTITSTSSSSGSSSSSSTVQTNNDADDSNNEKVLRNPAQPRSDVDSSVKNEMQNVPLSLLVKNDGDTISKLSSAVQQQQQAPMEVRKLAEDGVVVEGEEKILRSSSSPRARSKADDINAENDVQNVSLTTENESDAVIIRSSLQSNEVTKKVADDHVEGGEKLLQNSSSQRNKNQDGDFNATNDVHNVSLSAMEGDTVSSPSSVVQPPLEVTTRADDPVEGGEILVQHSISSQPMSQVADPKNDVPNVSLNSNNHEEGDIIISKELSSLQQQSEVITTKLADDVVVVEEGEKLLLLQKTSSVDNVAATNEVKTVLLSKRREGDLAVNTDANPPITSSSAAATATAAAGAAEASVIVAKEAWTPPNYYASDMTRLLERGANFITAYSGCNFAAWVARGGMHHKLVSDCNATSHEHQFLEGREHLVQAHDTIYVPVKGLAYFNQHVLPNITVPVIVMCGQFMRLEGNLSDGWQENFLPLYANPYVVKVFCHNAIEYAHQHHPKLEPFPYGIQPISYTPGIGPDPVETYRKLFYRYLELPYKKTDVMVGFLDSRWNPERKKIPIGKYMRPAQYYHTIARSRFILSPNGDRPECYRHYEAIGLGTIPITELDPLDYKHLRAAPVIYNTTNWTMTGKDYLKVLGLKEYPKVNRNMVFEEYWMEYIEGVVGMPLRWWDRNAKRRSHLQQLEIAQIAEDADGENPVQNLPPPTEMVAVVVANETTDHLSNVSLSNSEGDTTSASTDAIVAPVDSSSAATFDGWAPTYYSTNLTRLLERGANFITAYSGCYIASWVSRSGMDRKDVSDCNASSHEDQFIEGREHLVQANDTIYVPVKGLSFFNKHILPNITVPVIILSGQYMRLEGNMSDGWEENFLPLYSNPYVLKVFCHNAMEYAYQSHPKLEPLAYGIQPISYSPAGIGPDPVAVYRKIFYRYLELPPKKTDVMIGFLDSRWNPLRKNVPIGKYLRPAQYYHAMARSRFILSPNGDRPECYRHYEAIGLGTIPITELDPILHKHLRPAPVVYNTTNWTMTGKEYLQSLGLKQYPKVNRNMVFEEYWMEDIERIVGMPLRWWDRQAKRRSLLQQFKMANATEDADGANGTQNLSQQPTEIEVAVVEANVKTDDMIQASLSKVEGDRISTDAVAPAAASSSAASFDVWAPTYYSANMTRMLERGANFITAYSGCLIASWVTRLGMSPRESDCKKISHEDQFIETRVHMVQANDTIYVPVKGLSYFNKHILPNITVPVIILSGQFMRLDGKLSDGWEENFLPLYSNPYVVKVFCHNAIEYAHQDDPKLEPFAYGINPVGQDSNNGLSPFANFRQAFYRHIDLPNKTNDVMIDQLENRWVPIRKKIPIGKYLNAAQYYDAMASSRFILSPNGDRPESFRHYEALAFGAIPITELDPFHQRHLRAGPVIFDTTNWTMTGEKYLQSLGLEEFPTVNRNMIFEEYWMEDIERVVGMPLRWWDRNEKRRAFLQQFEIAEAALIV